MTAELKESVYLKAGAPTSWFLPNCRKPFNGAAIHGRQPGVQFVVVLEPQTRREETLTDKPDLVLDLSLLPARRRRAGDRIDEVMAAHLQESAIVKTLLADQDGRYRRLHVVVDAALACA